MSAMEQKHSQVSLAMVLVSVTVLCGVFACWSSEARIFVMPIAGAFLGGMLFPFGMRAGLAIAAVIVVVNAVLMEKDPSGLGPNEVVIPFHLILFGLPAAASAWLGRLIRNEYRPRIPSS
jgi:hypothetical protein